MRREAPPILATRPAGQVFLDDIHGLRGLAILMVVATHCVSAFAWAQHPFAFQLCLDLFDNSSLLFVFISGLLFQRQASDARFRYAGYLRRKLSSVVVPFMLLALPGALYTLRQPGIPRSLGIEGHGMLVRLGYLYLYPGSQVNYALWFIPVILLYFLAAPILRLPIRHPRLYASIPAFLLLSLCMHRPTYAHGHNLLLALYFLPAYLLGMACGQHMALIKPWLARHWRAIVAAALLVVAGHLLLAPHHGKYMLGEEAGTIDWLFLQKLLLCLGLWSLLGRVPRLRSALKPLADASFTIYFLHMYVLFTVEALVYHFHREEATMATWAALFAFAIGVPMAVAALTRTTTPRWSRMLVGA